MTETYWESAQKAHFRAAVALWAVATSVLDDVQNEVELSRFHNLEWAKTKAATYAKQARQAETNGYSLGPADKRDRALKRATKRYSEAVTAFQTRVLTVGGPGLLAQVNAVRVAS